MLRSLPDERLTPTYSAALSIPPPASERGRTESRASVQGWARLRSNRQQARCGMRRIAPGATLPNTSFIKEARS